MGGAVGCCGNALPAAEANVAHDPVAADVVLGASWATPPLLVGLDVTHRATLTSAELELARQGRTAAARFLADPLAFYARLGGTFTPDGEVPCHDLLAVMAAALADLVQGPVLPLAVQATPGPAWGMTVADRRQPHFARRDQLQATSDGFAPCQVGLDVDVDLFRRQLRSLLGDPVTTIG